MIDHFSLLLSHGLLLLAFVRLLNRRDLDDESVLDDDAPMDGRPEGASRADER